MKKYLIYVRIFNKLNVAEIKIKNFTHYLNFNILAFHCIQISCLGKLN